MTSWKIIFSNIHVVKFNYLARFLLIGCVMCLLTWVAYVQIGSLPLGVDDAHIFFVYGRNLVRGEGLVYNPGGERVEGYSSPLWMLIVAAVFLLPAYAEKLLLAISLLLISAALAFLWALIDKWGVHPLWSLVFLLWVFSSPGFVVWVSLTLMDAALWSSLLILGTVVVLSPGSPLSLLLVSVALLLTRPEGMAWSLLFIAMAGLAEVLRNGVMPAWRLIRLPLGGYMGTLAAMTIFRMWYFGYPLPNTYYAKMSADVFYNLKNGLIYFLGFVVQNKQATLALLSLFGGCLVNLGWLFNALTHPDSKNFSDTRWCYTATSLIGLVGIVIPVFVGGDHFPLFRFYQPVWPLIFLPFLCLVDSLRFEVADVFWKASAVFALVLFGVILSLSWTNRFYTEWIDYEFSLAEDGETLGRTLNAIFADDKPSVGVIAAGGVALTYEGTVVDVMGLNNLQMAHTPGDRHGLKNHAAFNVDVFLKQKPDVLVHARNDFLKGLLSDPRFLEAYQHVSISREDHVVETYVRRDYLQTLPKDKFAIVLLD